MMPPSLSARSKTVTAWPAWLSCAAQAEAGRSGADDRDLLPGADSRRVRLDQAVLETVLDDRQLVLADRHRVVVDPEDAGEFARRRADPPGDLRQVIRRVEQFQRPLPVEIERQVVPFRDIIADAGNPSGRTACRNPCSGKTGPGSFPRTAAWRPGRNP